MSLKVKTSRNVKELITILMCSIIAFTCFSGCSNFFHRNENEKIDTGKSQLYIGNCNGGLGFEWLEEVATAFEMKYADISFEEGKKGVQVIIDNSVIGTIDGDNLKLNLPSSRDDIFFTESVDYAYFVERGSFLNITDTVKEDMSEFGEPGVTLENKIGLELQEMLKSVDGNYYAIPFYEGLFGFTYDKALFDEKGIWFQDGIAYTSEDIDLDNPDLARVAGLFGGKQNKTAGRDGIKGTYDDGLPITYDDFLFMCIFMNACGITPIIWSGQHNDYKEKAFTNIWVQEAGLDFITMWKNLSGTATDLISVDNDGNKTSLQEVEITNRNAYELAKSESMYNFLSFCQKFFGNSSFFHTSCLDGTCSHIKAQAQFLYSSVLSSSNSIGFIAEGSYWVCESRETFKDMEASGDEYSLKNREIAFMPMPTSTRREGEMNTMLSFNDAFVFINAKSSGVNQLLAKKFLQFSSSDDMIFVFSKNTNMTRGLDFEPTSAQRDELSFYANSLLDLKKNSNIVSTSYTSALVRNRSDFFGLMSAFSTKVNNSTFSFPDIGTFNDNITVKKYFDGMYEYRVVNYPDF